MKTPTPLLARWILRKNAYSFDIKYRKGSANIVPDCLSRIEIVNTVSASTATDPWFDRLVKEVRENNDRYPDFKIVGENLYKNCIVKDELGSKCHRWKKVVPTHLRQDLIHRFHDVPTAAHLGCDRTIHRIQKEHYWPQMATDIRRYVQTCEVCKACKAPNNTLTPTLGHPKPAHLPWELISIDWIGPLTRSKNGNTVLLVIVDWITKFVICEPFRTANAHKMTLFLEQYVFLKF